MWKIILVEQIDLIIKSCCQIYTMTEDKIIRIIREHLEGLFPKVCPKCGKRFATFRDYICNTERIGPTIAYDAEMGNWEPEKPIGAVAHANCHCGNTLALATGGMPLSQAHLALKWVRIESHRRGLNPTELVGYLREEIRKQVIADPIQKHL
jgi:hypothetical protein